MPELPPNPHDPDPRTTLDEALRRAYRATRYRFAFPGGELLLRIDCHNEGLEELLRSAGHSCAAVLTAFNPGSQLLEPDRNLRAQNALERELQLTGLSYLTGLHEDPVGRWPDEAGLLVPGLECHAAHELAVRCGQLAFLWTDASATPRLVETTSSVLPRP